MSTGEEIIVLIKYSPKHEQLLGSLKEQVQFDDGNKQEVANDLLKTFTNKMDCPC